MIEGEAAPPTPSMLRAGRLASTLPAELIDAIITCALDESTITTSSSPMMDFYEKRAMAGDRRMLLSFALISRGWSGPAGRRIRMYLHPRVTSKASCDKVIRSLRRSTAQAPHDVKNLDIVFPSSFYGPDESVPCQCDGWETHALCFVCHFQEELEGFDDDDRVFCGPNEWFEEAHTYACTWNAARGPLLPTFGQVATLLSLCSRLTRLELVDVPEGYLHPSQRSFRGLASLKCIETFACTSYLWPGEPVYPYLFSSWPVLRHLYLAERAKSHDPQADEPLDWWMLRAGDEMGTIIPLPSAIVGSLHLPPPSPVPALATLSVSFSSWPGTEVLSRLVDPERPCLESLSITGPEDSYGRSDASYHRAVLPHLPAHLGSSLRFLKLNAAPDLTWGTDALLQWISQCDNLVELILGPEPPMTDLLLSSLPPRLQHFTYDFDASREVQYAFAAVDVLCDAPSLIGRAFTIDINIPSFGPEGQIGTRHRGYLNWSDTDCRHFIFNVARSVLNFRYVTMQGCTIYDHRRRWVDSFVVPITSDDLWSNPSERSEESDSD